jgi:enamine deaminase RidA (YjgF/YER057c/UK114 family)
LSYDALGISLQNGVSIPLAGKRAVLALSSPGNGLSAKENHSMEIDTRRSFFGKIAAMEAFVSGAPKLFSQQTPQAGPPPPSRPQMSASGDDRARRAANHTHNGIYYFSGTGSNDGYPKEDHILVTDPFEKHVTRTMDALKKSVEQAGCTMDSIIHAQVFFCLPLADGVPMPTGKARFDAYKAQYDALNKIYRSYFSPGNAPSRACMALDWIPGDSLIEIVGSARVVNTAPATPPAGE